MEHDQLVHEILIEYDGFECKEYYNFCNSNFEVRKIYINTYVYVPWVIVNEVEKLK